MASNCNSQDDVVRELYDNTQYYTAQLRRLDAEGHSQIQYSTENSAEEQKWLSERYDAEDRIDGCKRWLLHWDGTDKNLLEDLCSDKHEMGLTGVAAAFCLGLEKATQQWNLEKNAPDIERTLVNTKLAAERIFEQSLFAKPEDICHDAPLRL